MKATERVKAVALSAAISSAIAYLGDDLEQNGIKMLDLIDKFVSPEWFKTARGLIRESLEKKDNWYQLMDRMWHLDKNVRNTLLKNFLVNSALVGSARQAEISEKEDCNVPWAMLVDPTSACNLHCTGCWAAEYGNRLNLSFDELDSIVSQGKELGTYMYLFTGGEPMVRKDDIIKLCKKHNDCAFVSFTNGTLIDEAFVEKMKEVGNFVPAISLEGFEEANDFRRGNGVYGKVRHTMKLLKDNGLPFGISTCYTSKNAEDISSDDFFDMIIEQGAYFIWLFHYMPVGAGAVTDLLPTPEQREHLMHKIREFRKTKAIFSIDFQNDAEYVGGCVAGGRKYLHINAKGDIEPCAFIHYSDSNIREKTILEALKSPLFMAYHRMQPFNENMLRPCPMLENPEKLVKMQAESGAHSTEYESPESAVDLSKKTVPYAERWTPKADELWQQSPRCKCKKNA